MATVTWVWTTLKLTHSECIHSELGETIAWCLWKPHHTPTCPNEQEWGHKPACDFEAASPLEISRYHCSCYCSFQWKTWVLNSCFSGSWPSPGSLPTFESDPVWPPKPGQRVAPADFSSIHFPSLQPQKPPIQSLHLPGWRGAWLGVACCPNTGFPGKWLPAFKQRLRLETLPSMALPTIWPKTSRGNLPA